MGVLSVCIQDVTEEMGPTMMFPYSHSAQNTEHNRRRTHMQRHYDASGRPVPVLVHAGEMSTVEVEQQPVDWRARAFAHPRAYSFMLEIVVRRPPF